MTWRTATTWILLVAAIASGWMLWRQSAPESASPKAQFRPDYVLNDLELVALDNEGRESFTLRAPRLTRDPTAKSSLRLLGDTDLTHASCNPREEPEGRGARWTLEVIKDAEERSIRSCNTDWGLQDIPRERRDPIELRSATRQNDASAGRLRSCDGNHAGNELKHLTHARLNDARELDSLNSTSTRFVGHRVLLAHAHGA